MALKAGATRQAKHDWVEARRMYVESVTGEKQVTLDDVAAHMGVSAARVRERAGREDWTGERNKFRTKVEQARTDKQARDVGKEQAKWDSDVLKVARAQLGMVVKRINELTAAPDDPKKKLPPVDTRDMLRLTQALNTVHAIGRKALGMNETLPFAGAARSEGGGGVGVMRFEWVNGGDPTDRDYD